MNYPDSGAVFKNNFKDNERKPDFKGEGNFSGIVFEVAAWERKDKNGNTYFSLKFSEPFNKEVHEQSNTKPKESFTITETEDPLPF